MCEVEETPCISTVAPWQPYFIGRQQNPGNPGSWKPFNYTYHFFWGLEDVIAVFTNMWGQLSTNKSVGGLFPNDGDGNAWGDKQVGFPPVLDRLGYKLTDPGRYQNLTDNFTAQITAFKRDNCEIVTGVVLPPDFTTFWNQARQQGFRPKIASVGKALLFPVAVEALGRNGNNLSTEVWWSPSHPFKSSLTGQSAREIATAYEQASRKQWTQPIGFVHALFEVAVDVLKRSADKNDPKATVAAIARDQARHHRRAHRMERKGAAAVRAEEHRQDAAGRRPMAAARRLEIRHRHHRQQDRAADSGRRQDGADRLTPMRPAAGVAAAYLTETGHLLEPHGLGEAEHQVHVLHRLARRALGEVVERRADDGAAWNAVLRHPDERHVGAAHMPGLRHLAERQHMHEWLLRVEL